MKRFHRIAVGVAAVLMAAGQTGMMSYAMGPGETEPAADGAAVLSEAEAAADGAAVLSEAEAAADGAGVSAEAQAADGAGLSAEAQAADGAGLSAETEAARIEVKEPKTVREGTDREGISWIDREYQLMTKSQSDAGTVTLRFYEDLPNVAYISAPYFHELAKAGEKPRCEEKPDGVYVLTGNGAQAEIDTKRDTVSFDDYYAFTDTAGSSQTAKTGELLDGAPFARYAGCEVDPQAGAVSFDFAEYEIDLRGDEKGPYLPLYSLSSLYDDTSFLHHVLYNSEFVLFNNDTVTLFADELDPQWYDPLLRMGERPEDLASYSYSQLCFSLEHFYGYAGRELIDETIMKEEGLDAALKAYGEMGENAARLLQSTNLAEYFAGGERLRLLLWDGDHTNLDFVGNTGAYTNLLGTELVGAVNKIDEELDDGYRELALKLLQDAKGEESVYYFARDTKRKESLGEGTYFTKGNTAWCVFDGFQLNKEAWDAYYADENRNLDAFLESTQDDSVVILLSALKKAQSDPDITNFVVDMTQNPGGNDGVAAAVMSLLTKEAKWPMIDMLTGYPYVSVTEVDRNFDCVFDEKDEEVSYDFHFAVILSNTSYSNATICPAALKDSGILILGETSRGGCCSLQLMSTAEGIESFISSGRTHHVTANGEDIDSGVVPDIELYMYNEEGDRVETARELQNSVTTWSIAVPDYSLFYDIEYVGNVIDEYYAQSSEQTAEQATEQ